MFPVKLTEPITAILYITQDKEHIEELRHAIHVKEVAEGNSIINIQFHSFALKRSTNIGSDTVKFRGVRSKIDRG